MISERRDSYFMPGHYAVPVYCNEWLIGSFQDRKLAVAFINARRQRFPQNNYSMSPPAVIGDSNDPSRRITEDIVRDRRRRAARALA